MEGLISLPPALFRSTGVPAMIWLLTPSGKQRNEILFIDASGAGRWRVGHSGNLRIPRSKKSSRSSKAGGQAAQ